MAEYIGKKGFRAKGKKVSWLDIKGVRFIEPLVKEMPEEEPEAEEPGNDDDLPEEGGGGGPMQVPGVDNPDEPNWSNPEEPTLF